MLGLLWCLSVISSALLDSATWPDSNAQLTYVGWIFSTKDEYVVVLA
jgi:hypothetical protein